MENKHEERWLEVEWEALITEWIDNDESGYITVKEFFNSNLLQLAIHSILDDYMFDDTKISLKAIENLNKLWELTKNWSEGFEFLMIFETLQQKIIGQNPSIEDIEKFLENDKLIEDIIINQKEYINYYYQKRENIDFRSERVEYWPDFSQNIILLIENWQSKEAHNELKKSLINNYINTKTWENIWETITNNFNEAQLESTIWIINNDFFIDATKFMLIDSYSENNLLLSEKILWISMPTYWNENKEWWEIISIMFDQWEEWLKFVKWISQCNNDFNKIKNVILNSWINNKHLTDNIISITKYYNPEISQTQIQNINFLTTISIESNRRLINNLLEKKEEMKWKIWYFLNENNIEDLENKIEASISLSLDKSFEWIDIINWDVNEIDILKKFFNELSLQFITNNIPRETSNEIIQAIAKNWWNHNFNSFINVFIDIKEEEEINSRVKNSIAELHEKWFFAEFARSWNELHFIVDQYIRNWDINEETTSIAFERMQLFDLSNNLYWEEKERYLQFINNENIRLEDVREFFSSNHTRSHFEKAIESIEEIKFWIQLIKTNPNYLSELQKYNSEVNDIRQSTQIIRENFSEIIKDEEKFNDIFYNNFVKNVDPVRYEGWERNKEVNSAQVTLNNAYPLPPDATLQEVFSDWRIYISNSQAVNPFDPEKLITWRDLIDLNKNLLKEFFNHNWIEINSIEWSNDNFFSRFWINLDKQISWEDINHFAKSFWRYLVWEISENNENSSSLEHIKAEIIKNPEKGLNSFFNYCKLNPWFDRNLSSIDYEWRFMLSEIPEWLNIWIEERYTEQKRNLDNSSGYNSMYSWIINKANNMWERIIWLFR